MEKTRPHATPFANHFILSSKQSPTRKFEKEEMQKVPCALTFESLMYVMVCTQTNII